MLHSSLSVLCIVRMRSCKIRSPADSLGRARPDADGTRRVAFAEESVATWVCALKLLADTGFG